MVFLSSASLHRYRWAVRLWILRLHSSHRTTKLELVFLCEHRFGGPGGHRRHLLDHS